MDEKYLKKITVKIIANGNVIGAGVIIDNKHVLTCNHVVEYYSQVKIGFLDDYKVINASVIDRNKIKDYAILELKEEVSDDRIARLGTKYSDNDEFHSIGFALQNELEYIHATGQIVDETRKNDIKMLQLDSKNISEGMSGAPVYNVNTRRIIGIISKHFKTSNFEYRDLSLAIPIDIIDNDIVKQNVERYKIDEKLRRFLEKQKEYFARESKIDHKRLKDYYVPNDLVKADIATWNEDELSYNDIIDSNWSINKFLESDEPITVIGSEFGMGKSSYAKYIVYNLAESCLEGKNGYIPIFINLATEDINYNLELTLSKLPNNASYNKILLILDGLDEYNGDVKQLIDKLGSYEVSYKEKRGIDLKVIITTRMIDSYSNILKKIKINEYVRIKPFDEEQINEFFKKYGVDLTYEYLKDTLGLSDDEILKPLFAWMIAYMHKEGDGLRKIDVSKLKIKDDSVKYRIVRTILYHNFISALVRGKHRDEALDELKASYSAEKELLRVLSAINNIYGKIEGDINKLIEPFNIKYNNIDRNNNRNNIDIALEYIIESYFYTSETNPYKPTKVYKFIHKSIQEYLLAEYLYENIKNNNIHRLAIGLPSKECIGFLYGLIDILKYYDDDVKDMLDYPKEKDGEPLVKPLVNEDDINGIVNNCKSIIKDDKIILYDTENKDGFIISKDNNANRYSKLYIHRWIAVNILSWLSDEEDRKLGDDIKEYLSSLIRETSHNIETYLKYLKYSKLSGAKLSGADLSGADLSKADLSRAILSKAKLYGADLSEAILYRAKLSGADLSEAILYRADLSNANLSGANITNVIFYLFSWEDEDILNSNLGSFLQEFGKDIREYKLTRNNNKITLTRDNSEIIIELKDNKAILTIYNKKLKLDVIKEDNKTKIFIPIRVNEYTNTKGIILTDSNDKKSIKKALSNLHPNLREIVLRDNRNYKEIWDESIN